MSLAISGEWAIQQSDSWRISSDIRPTFSSIIRIIDINADLYKYSSVGHYNDMDMLQVGRGMSYDEDKTHFTMWCMLNSPLLAGNDLRNMTKQTIEVLTNKEVIALNQDKGFKQAKRIIKDKNIEVWIKDLGLSTNKAQAIAIVNRGSEEATYELESKKIGINSKTKLRDLWLHKNAGLLGNSKHVIIPKHGIAVFKTM